MKPWLLVLNWPSSSCCDHWGSESVDVRSLSLYFGISYKPFKKIAYRWANEYGVSRVDRLKKIVWEE